MQEPNPQRTPDSVENALDQCLELWQLIALRFNTLPKSNQRFRGFNNVKRLVAEEIGMSHYYEKCPCCEYTVQLSRIRENRHEINWVDCELCPLWGTKGGLYSCEHPDSPYAKWRMGQGPATAMVDLIKQVITTGEKVNYDRNRCDDDFLSDPD